MSFNPKDHIQESYTPNPITFTIIYIDDISKSKLAKLDQWRRLKDPLQVSVDRLNHGTLITEINDGENTNVSVAKSSDSVYKLTLKDDSDNYCFAYEYNDRLLFLRTGVDLPIPIKLGGRLVVKKGTLVTNGCLMLKNAQVDYLGVEDGDFANTLNANLVEKSIEILSRELS